MERTYIAWNLPNMITVPLMALVALFVVSLVWQFVRSWKGNSSAVSAMTSDEDA